MTLGPNLICIYDCLFGNGRRKMDLREYLFRNKLHLSEFARIVNYSRQHVSGVMHGAIKPGRKLAQAIEKATNGAVKAVDLMQGQSPEPPPENER